MRAIKRQGAHGIHHQGNYTVFVVSSPSTRNRSCQLILDLTHHISAAGAVETQSFKFPVVGKTGLGQIRALIISRQARLPPFTDQHDRSQTRQNVFRLHHSGCKPASEIRKGGCVAVYHATCRCLKPIAGPSPRELWAHQRSQHRQAAAVEGGARS